MYDHLLREPKRVVLLPLARAVPFSPNALTGLGLLLGLTAALCCCFGWFHLALGLWMANRVVDGLDGEVARLRGTQTDLGGYLDILADLLVYALIPLGMAIHVNQQSVWATLGMMLSAFYLNVGSWMYLSSILEKHGVGAAHNQELTTVSMPRGLVEGAETGLFYCLFLLYPNHLALLFGLFSFLTFAGAALRVRWAARTLPGLQSTKPPTSEPTAGPSMLG